MIDLNDLRRIAVDARGAQWRWEKQADNTSFLVDDIGRPVLRSRIFKNGKIFQSFIAAQQSARYFIPALSPAVVIELIDRLEMAERIIGIKHDV